MYLPSSIYNYDVYNSSGQGLSGYFRPRRSDVGRVHDPKQKNANFGASAALEIGAGAVGKYGVDFGGSFGWSSQGAWNKNNDMQYDFEAPQTAGKNENLYYQVHGETTILNIHELDYMNGLDLPFVAMRDKHNDGLAGGKRKIDQNTTHSSANEPYRSRRTPDDRIARNTMIHTLTNDEVAGGVKKMGSFPSSILTTKQMY